jgi:ferredoxin-NADP reductase
MRIYKAKLQQIIKRTPTVESFRFIPEEKINFIPGQFLKLIFDEKNLNNQELNKYLSFSSSPTHSYIEVTKRMSESQFSHRLKSLRLNEQVLLRAPLGNSVFRDEYKKIGFLIGGIGITPVISIIEYIINRKLNTDVVLLYSNRIEEEIAFKSGLDLWQSNNYNIKVFYILTECQPKDSNCLFGRIDKELVLKNAPDLKERVFFIFGPPRMVDSMHKICLSLGCGKDNIITESFVGY